MAWAEWAVVVVKAAAAQDTTHSLASEAKEDKVVSPSDLAEHQSSWTEAKSHSLNSIVL